MTTPAPARLPIADGVQLTLSFIHAGSRSNVVLGFDCPGAFPLTEANVAVLRDAFWTPMRNLVTAQAYLAGAIARRTDADDPDVVEVGTPSAPDGAHTGTSVFAAATTLILWKTGTGGRSGKGRTFLPALASNATQAPGTEYVPAYRNTVQTAVNAYLTSSALATAGAFPAILSFTKGQSYRITSGACAQTPGVQRRRMRA